MLDEGIIEPALGPWASPMVIVPKSSSEWRFCVDNRSLNNITVRNSHPMPRIDDSLDFLSRGKFISTTDLARGYWQVGVEESSCPKTAFTSHCVLLQFRVMPFGFIQCTCCFSTAHELCLGWADIEVLRCISRQYSGCFSNIQAAMKKCNG